MGYSTEQIRAALAALDIDPDEVARQLKERDDPEFDADGVEHAALTGLLYRKLATELRETITHAQGIQQFMHRYLAVSPQNISVSGEDRAAQADFDAHWLDDRVSAMDDTEVERDDQDRVLVPTLHGAIGQAAEATKVLLEIDRDRRAGTPVDSETTSILFDTVIDRLLRCRGYAEVARRGVTTMPLSDD